MPILKFLKRKKTRASQSSTAKQNAVLERPILSEDIGPKEMPYVIAKSTNSAFQEAWNKHWQELDASEQEAWSIRRFCSPSEAQQMATDEDLLHQEKHASRNIAGPALKFLKAIETVMAGVTIGLQAYPNVTSLVVGAIRIVINVAFKYFEYYEKLSKMLEELVDDIQVLNLFTQNKVDSPELHETLVTLYTNILSFCRYARRAFLVSGRTKGTQSLALLLKVQWAPFEEQFGEIRSNLDRSKAKLDRITAAITMNTTLSIGKDLEQRSAKDAENERISFLSWICTENIEEVHNTVRKQRLEDTGSFVFDQGSYQKWLSENSRPLWIYGEAGTGKSVIASMIIDRFSQESYQRDTSVAYVYIKGEDTRLRKSPSLIMSMLIKQLCWKLEVLPSYLVEYYHQCKKDARIPVLNQLATMLQECVTSLDRVILVIDGLDECEKECRGHLLDVLLSTSHHKNVKLLITSRWELDIKRAIYRTDCLIIPKITSNPTDIEKVVKYRVKKELAHLKEPTQEFVIEQLVKKAGGIFLWVDFQLKELSIVLERDVKTQLDHLPSDIRETYIQYFRKINAQPTTSRNLAQRCFLWAFHTNKLLDSGEFLDAISAVSDHEKISYEASEVVTVTKNLLRVSGFALIRVRPVHFSLREFAVDAQSMLPLELQDLIPNRQTANARMAVECLNHLLLENLTVDLFFSIMPYCSQNFDAYIKELDEIPENILQMLDRVLQNQNNLLLKILTGRWPVPTSDEKEPEYTCIGSPPSIDPLFFLRCLKLDQIPVIQKRYAHLKRLENYPDGYLHVAAMTGLEDIVTELLQRNVDPDLEDIWHCTPLRALCEAPKPLTERVVTILLEAGADPDRPSLGFDHTPYQQAQYYNRTELVRIIDEFKASRQNKTLQRDVNCTQNDQLDEICASKPANEIQISVGLQPGVTGPAEKLQILAEATAL